MFSALTASRILILMSPDRSAGRSVLSRFFLSCRAQGTQLEEDNERISNDIQTLDVAVADAKAQLEYYEGHQHDTKQKVHHKEHLFWAGHVAVELLGTNFLAAFRVSYLWALL